MDRKFHALKLALIATLILCSLNDAAPAAAETTSLRLVPRSFSGGSGATDYHRLPVRDNAKNADCSEKSRESHTTRSGSPRSFSGGSGGRDLVLLKEK